MKRMGVYLFSDVLQRVVILLRLGQLLDYNQFPVLLTPILNAHVNCRRQGKMSPWFLAKIRVKSSSIPDQIWILFKRRGKSIYISNTGEDWVELCPYYRSVLFKKDNNIHVWDAIF